MRYFQNKNIVKIFPLNKIILVVLVSVTVTGCIPSIGNNNPKPKSEGEFKTGTIVAGFPPLPTYPKVKVIESYGSSNSYGATFTTDAPLTQVFDYYNGALATLGWTSTVHKKTETNIVYDVKNDKYSGQVIINTAADGKTTAITLAVSAR